MTLDEMFVNVFDHLVVLQSRRFTSYHCQVSYFTFQGLLFAKKLHIPTGLERDILKQVVPGLNVNVHNDLLVVGLSKLLGHPRHLCLHVLLQHNCVHRILEEKTSHV